MEIVPRDSFRTSILTFSISIFDPRFLDEIKRDHLCGLRTRLTFSSSHISLD
jgi:hypothetical protein